MITGLLKYIHFFIILFAAWQWYGDYQQSIVEREEVEAGIAKEQSDKNLYQKKKTQLENYLADIESAKEKIEHVAKEIEKIQQKFPSQISDPDNLELFKNFALGLNIKKIFLTPKGEEQHGFYITKDYEFKGTGTFLQFLIFLEKIGDHNSLLNIKNLEIVRSDSRQKGRFQLSDSTIVIQAYKHNPNYREDRGISEIENKFIEQKNTGGKKKRKKNKQGDEE